jgi:hypothetical protein
MQHPPNGTLSAAEVGARQSSGRTSTSYLQSSSLELPPVDMVQVELLNGKLRLLRLPFLSVAVQRTRSAPGVRRQATSVNPWFLR